jgi:hypothetical protein
MPNAHDIIARLRHSAAPAIHLRGAPRSTSSPSRLGGSPDLPPGFEWPRSPHGNLAFIAQLDLAQLNGDGRINYLPRAGRLLVFYDARECADGSRPGDRAHWCVTYIGAADVSALGRRPLPPDLRNECLDYPEIPLMPHAIETTPREWRLDPPVDPDTLSSADCEELDRFVLKPFDGLPRHQVGGFPFPLTSDTMDFDCPIVAGGLALEDNERADDPRAAELYRSSPPWRLVLQLDSDPLGGMSWGHRGLLYVWAPEDSAREGRFNDAWVMVQSQLD